MLHQDSSNSKVTTKLVLYVWRVPCHANGTKDTDGDGQISLAELKQGLAEYGTLAKDRKQITDNP
eukprot:5014472-Amphidinium_carterae.1